MKKKIYSASTAIATTVIVLILCAAMFHAPFLKRFGVDTVMMTALFMYVPVYFFWRRSDADFYGISIGTGARGLGVTLIAAVAALVPFYTVFFFIYDPVTLTDIFPKHPIRMLLVQFLIIALPEELFFRGWLQTELEEKWKRKWNVLGSSLGAGWLVSNLLFSAAHIAVEPSWMRAAVFFPGLLFGWLFKKTRSVFFPVLLHALFNVSIIIVNNMMSAGF